MFNNTELELLRNRLYKLDKNYDELVNLYVKMRARVESLEKVSTTMIFEKEKIQPIYCWDDWHDNIDVKDIVRQILDHLELEPKVIPPKNKEVVLVEKSEDD